MTTRTSLRLVFRSKTDKEKDQELEEEAVEAKTLYLWVCGSHFKGMDPAPTGEPRMWKAGSWKGMVSERFGEAENTE